MPRPIPEPSIVRPTFSKYSQRVMKMRDSEKPQDVVEPGQEVEVKILKVDNEARKIGLSLRRVQWAAEDQAKAESGDSIKDIGEAPAEHSGPYADTFQISIRPTDETEKTEETEETEKTEKTEE